VYRAVNAEGETIYIGVTNNITRRAAEQLRTKGIEINPVEGLGELSDTDGHAVEQVLIEANGLSKNGGTLINQINSIAKSNPIYAQSMQRGAQLLEDAEVGVGELSSDATQFTPP
jgi:filamentous hemagglutinin